MDAISLAIMFYLYAGLMFSSVSVSNSLFPETGCLTQAFFWPALFAIYAFRRIRESDFGWFVRYKMFKLRNR